MNLLLSILLSGVNLYVTWQYPLEGEENIVDYSIFDNGRLIRAHVPKGDPYPAAYFGGVNERLVHCYSVRAVMSNGRLSPVLQLPCVGGHAPLHVDVVPAGVE